MEPSAAPECPAAQRAVGLRPAAAQLFEAAPLELKLLLLLLMLLEKQAPTAQH
jgi:hypothetical protein